MFFRVFLSGKFKLVLPSMGLTGEQVIKDRIHLPKRRHEVPFQVTWDICAGPPNVAQYTKGSCSSVVAAEGQAV